MEKPQLELIPADFDDEEAKAWASGIKEGREAHDWRTTATVAKYESKILRHLREWRMGNRFDQESGAHHLAHVICNARILMYAEQKEQRARAQHGISPRNN